MVSGHLGLVHGRGPGLGLGLGLVHGLGLGLGLGRGPGLGRYAGREGLGLGLGRRTDARPASMSSVSNEPPSSNFFAVCPAPFAESSLTSSSWGTASPLSSF